MWASPGSQLGSHSNPNGLKLKRPTRPSGSSPSWGRRWSRSQSRCCCISRCWRRCLSTPAGRLSRCEPSLQPLKGPSKTIPKNSPQSCLEAGLRRTRIALRSRMQSFRTSKASCGCNKRGNEILCAPQSPALAHSFSTQSKATVRCRGEARGIPGLEDSHECWCNNSPCNYFHVF